MFESRSNCGRVATLVLASLLTAVFVGCETTGVDRSQRAVKGVNQTIAQINVAKVQVDKSLAAMNAIPPAPDLKPAYDAFLAELQRTKDTAADVKDTSVDMHKRGQDYIKAWQDEMALVNNTELKAAADARRAAVAEKYSQIQDKYNAARDAYTTFIADLDAIKVYLANDLTPAGVKAIKPSFDKATADGAALKVKADAVNSQLVALRAAMSTSSIPAPAPAPAK
jgi:hypothetical protein